MYYLYHDVVCIQSAKREYPTTVLRHTVSQLYGLNDWCNTRYKRQALYLRQRHVNASVTVESLAKSIMVPYTVSNYQPSMSYEKYGWHTKDILCYYERGK